MWDKSKNVKFLVVRRRLKGFFLWCLSSHHVNEFPEAHLGTLLICPMLSALCLPPSLCVPQLLILPPSVSISHFCAEVSWLKCCVSFWSVAKWVIQISLSIRKYIYIYIFILIYVFQSLVHYNLLPDVECTSLCCRAGPVAYPFYIKCCVYRNPKLRIYPLPLWWP